MTDPQQQQQQDVMPQQINRPFIPLSDPRILAKVAQHLRQQKHDLQSCCRVSQCFHEAFMPVLWSDLTIPYVNDKQNRYGDRYRYHDQYEDQYHVQDQQNQVIEPSQVSHIPPIKALQRNAHLIESLKFIGDVTRAYISDVHYSELRRLLIELDSPSGQSDWMSRVLFDVCCRPHLLDRFCKTLQEIRVVSLSGEEATEMFTRFLTQLQDLRVLKLQGLYFKYQHQKFLQICRTVTESLCLHSITVYGADLAAPSSLASGSIRNDYYNYKSSYSSLQHFSVDKISCDASVFQGLVELLLGATKIRSLTLKNLGDAAFAEENFLAPLTDALSLNRLRWQELTSLDLENSEMEDLVLGNFLGALSCGLEVLNAGFSLFHVFSAASLLLEHATTLTHLNLRGCKDVTSEMLHAFLCNCLCLRSIQGGEGAELLASDLMDGQEWICTGLQDWGLDIVMNGSGYQDDDRGGENFDEEEVQDQDPDVDAHCEIFRRLSDLPQLRRLSCWALSWKHQLQWQVDLGVGLLRPLVDLEELQFDQRKILEEDWEWILETFGGQLRKVVTLQGSCDEIRSRFLTKLAKTHDRIEFVFIDV